MVWKDIVKLALVGTERGQLQNSTQQELEILGIDTNTDSAEIILKASALLSKMKRAGYQPIRNTTIVEPPAPPETQDLCNKKSVQHLLLILGGSYKDALPEFLETLGRIGKRLPEEVLPDVLEMGKKKPKQWNLLRKIIGTRGEWLVRQNPNWQYIILNTEAENWETATKTERLALLRHWRSVEPQQALEMLEATWKYENINDKLDFLKILKIKLSISDEAFLEKSLDAKRKEERKLAAKLLSKIPESQLIQRMYQRIAPLLTIQKKQLHIQLPNEINEEAQRDGIDIRTQWIRGGVKASRLGQMLAVIPPQMLETHFGRAPKKILELYWKSDWRELLFQSILESTAIHNNQFWTDAIFTFWHEKAQKEDLSNFINLTPLLENISENLFNKIGMMGLANTRTLLDESHPVIQLLKLSPHKWEPQLTKVFILGLQSWMSNATAYWSGWHYKAILKKAAYNSDPKLVSQLDLNWPRNQRIWGFWEKEVEEFLSVLHFRKEMLETLQK